MAAPTNRIIQVLEQSQIQLLADWIKALRTATGARSSKITDPELQAQCQAFIGLLRDGIASGNLTELGGA